jgi:hypothetical protein
MPHTEDWVMLVKVLPLSGHVTPVEIAMGAGVASRREVQRQAENAINPALISMKGTVNDMEPSEFVRLHSISDMQPTPVIVNREQLGAPTIHDL